MKITPEKKEEKMKIKDWIHLLKTGTSVGSCEHGDDD
jgi:hypothetical protein